MKEISMDSPEITNETGNRIDIGTPKSTILKEWTTRIAIDSISIWESQLMKNTFPLTTLEKIRVSWVDSTIHLILSEIEEQGFDSQSNKLEQASAMYEDYMRRFMEIAARMLRKKRQRDLAFARERCIQLFTRTMKEDCLDEKESMAEVLPTAYLHPTEGVSLVFGIIRDRLYVFCQ